MRFVLLMTLVSFVNSNCALCFFSYLFFRKISFLWKHTKSTKLYHPSFEIHCKYEIATLVIFDFIFQWNPKVPNKLFIRFWETSIFDFSFEIWIWHVLLLTFFPKDFLRWTHKIHKTVAPKTVSPLVWNTAQVLDNAVSSFEFEIQSRLTISNVKYSSKFQFLINSVKTSTPIFDSRRASTTLISYSKQTIRSLYLCPNKM